MAIDVDRFLLEEAKLWLSDKDFMEIRLKKGWWMGVFFGSSVLYCVM